MNVLIWVMDDMGREQIRPTGTLATAAVQLNVEGLCQRGVRFTRAWSAPACSMTRANGQTGRYGFHTGVGALVESTQQPLLPAEVCLPRGLKRATGNGYQCGIFGKWHLSTAANGRGQHPLDCGWDVYQGCLRNLERGQESYYSWNRWEGNSYKRCNEYAVTRNVTDALDWISTVNGPWLCWIAPNVPHSPYERPPATHYDTSTYVLPDAVSPGGVSDLTYFKAMVQSGDYELGRFLNSLDPGVRANTLVIWTADNGTTGGVVEPPLTSAHAKSTCYEGGVGVPMVVSGPLVGQPGRTSDALFHFVDIYRTVVEMCDGDWSLVNPLTPFDGVSLDEVIKSSAAVAPRTTMYTESFSPNGANLNAAKAGRRAIINAAGYKLMTYAAGVSFPQLGGAGTGAEFYNTTTDPNEASNLLVNGDPSGLTGAAASNYASLVSAYTTTLST